MIRVPARGPSKAKIMLVGEAPGREEEVAGEPFVGNAGRILDSRLHSVGINPADCIFTNMCKYRPPNNELVRWFDPKTGAPGKEVTEGLVELREEIEAADPTVIVALGNYPLWALTGKTRPWNSKKNSDTKLPYGYTGISDWRGSIIEGYEGRKVVAAYHPAAVARKWPWRVYLDLDLKRALEQSLFSGIRRPSRKIIVDPDGQSRAEYLRQWLETGSILYSDIEYIRDRLLCISFCQNSGETIVIPTRNSSDITFVRSVLESGLPLAFQNAMYDCSVLEYWYKIRCYEHLVYDTMLASHAAYIELPKDLGTLCSIYTEQPCYWTHINWSKIKTGQQPISDVYEYNGLDSWVTHEVAQHQQNDELLDPAVRKVFDFEMALIRPLWKLARRGVRLDMPGIRKLAGEIDDSISLNQTILEVLTGQDINVQSPLDMKWLIEKKLGLSVQRLTKTGKSSWDAKSLAAAQLLATTDEQRETIRVVRSIKKDRALKSKFLNMDFGTAGRFYHIHNPGGTNTGRLSSSAFHPTGEGGNGQNIPRDKRIRSKYIADEGYTFFYNDLERAESLVVAHLTGDPLMLAHHAPGVNAHKKLAVLLFDGLREEEIDKDGFEYFAGKQTRHAGNYMQGAVTFMRNFNLRAQDTGFSIDLRAAKAFGDRYKTLHIGLRPWWNSIERDVRTRGSLCNLLGRPRTFYDRIDSTLPEAVAYIPQSTVGDVLNTALLRIDADEELRDYDLQLLLQIHDALGGQVRTEFLDAAMSRMRQLMQVELTNPRTLETFVIPIELTCGPSWGECKEWHPASK